MAVQRLTMTQIGASILENLGYKTHALAPWLTVATLTLRVNEYIQRLPLAVATVGDALRQKGQLVPFTGVPKLDMWRTTASLTATAGSSTVYFPADYDHYISFWDETNSKQVHPIDEVDRYHRDLKLRNPGPPEAIEIFGFEAHGVPALWSRKGILHPATMATVTPAITLTYWRVPASMDSAAPDTSFPDLDPKFEALAIVGPTCEIARHTGKEFERYDALEKDLLGQLAMTARGV